MREIRLAIFDLDNTLWDSFAANERAAVELVHALGKSSGVSQQRVAQGMKQALEEDGDIFYYPATISCNRALEKPHPQPDLALRHAHEREAFDRRVDSLVVPYGGIRETLVELKRRGIRLACYSESLAPKVVARLKLLGLEDMFDLVYSSPDGNEPPRSGMPVEYATVDCGLAVPHWTVACRDGLGPKAHPEILLHILAECGVKAKHAAMVGDHPVRDVAMAMKVGVMAIHAEWGEGSFRDLKLTPEIHPYVRQVRDAAMRRTAVHADLVAKTPRRLLDVLRGPGFFPKG